MNLSNRAQKIKPSPLHLFFDQAKKLKAQGRQIIDLGVGEPHLPTPAKIKRAGAEAIKANKTHYTPVSGLLELRKEIVKKFKSEGLKCTPKNIVVSSGAKPLLGAFLWTLVDRSEGVIIPHPAYPVYKALVESLGGRIIKLKTEKDNFQVTAKNLKEVLAKNKAKILILNSPNNPTGAVYNKKTLIKISRLVKKYNLTVISDEAYNGLLFEGKHFSIARLPGMLKRTVVIRSFSKNFRMTGWRVGFALAPQVLIPKINAYLNMAIGSAPEISQWAALAGLKQRQDYPKELNKTLKANRDILVKGLENLGLKIIEPQGAFYCFIDISPWFKRGVKDALTFCQKLLYKKGVVITPGEAFGGYKNYVRISFAVEQGKLKLALDKIREFINLK